MTSVSVQDVRIYIVPCLSISPFLKPATSDNNFKMYELKNELRSLWHLEYYYIEMISFVVNVPPLNISRWRTIYKADIWAYGRAFNFKFWGHMGFNKVLIPEWLSTVQMILWLILLTHICRITACFHICTSGHIGYLCTVITL